jgi:DNA modification methylase
MTDQRSPRTKTRKIIELIIKASSIENDIVLNFFSGTGKIGKIVEQLNHKWIGIEKMYNMLLL